LTLTVDTNVLKSYLERTIGVDPHACSHDNETDEDHFGRVEGEPQPELERFLVLGCVGFKVTHWVGSDPCCDEVVADLAQGRIEGSKESEKSNSEKDESEDIKESNVILHCRKTFLETKKN
jgi:hypothetical protein